MGNGCSCIRSLEIDRTQIQFETAAIIESSHPESSLLSSEQKVYALPSIDYLVQLQSAFRTYEAYHNMLTLTTERNNSIDCGSETELEHHVPYITQSDDRFLQNSPCGNQKFDESTRPRTEEFEDSTKLEEVFIKSAIRGYLTRIAFIKQQLPSTVSFCNSPTTPTDTCRAQIEAKPYVCVRHPTDNTPVHRLPRVVFEDGSTYDGEWNGRGQMHGLGSFVWPDGAQYTGWFKTNMCSFKGRIVHSNGDIYEGDWQNGLADGTGTFMYKDGSVYSGNWVKDTQEGFGTEKWPDGSVYQGIYFNNLKHGPGKLTWTDGSYYEGGFSKDFYDGQGKFHWNEEKRYEGSWRAGKMHGMGTLISKEGIYTGEFRNDKRHGEGVLITPNGTRLGGLWQLGKFIGENRSSPSQYSKHLENESK